MEAENPCMKGYLNKLINFCASTATHRKDVERQTIEYWSEREPFRSSGRAFGHIELINPIETPWGPHLAVRGWIFDASSELKHLRIIHPFGDTGTTIANLVRDDVVVNMRSYPHARTSGFLSLLPLRQAIHELQLRASYHISEEQINVIFETTPVSLGVTNPGEILRASGISLSEEKNYVAIILLPQSVPNTSIIECILQEQAALASSVVVFSDMLKKNLDELSSAPMWHRRIDASLRDVAGTLLQFRKSLSKIFAVGPLESEIVRTQVLPVLAHPPTPQLTWIPSVIGNSAITNLIPRELRGKLIEAVTLGRLERLG